VFPDAANGKPVVPSPKSKKKLDELAPGWLTVTVNVTDRVPEEQSPGAPALTVTVGQEGHRSVCGDLGQMSRQLGELRSSAAVTNPGNEGSTVCPQKYGQMFLSNGTTVSCACHCPWMTGTVAWRACAATTLTDAKFVAVPLTTSVPIAPAGAGGTAGTPVTEVMLMLQAIGQSTPTEAWPNAVSMSRPKYRLVCFENPMMDKNRKTAACPTFGPLLA